MRKQHGILEDNCLKCRGEANQKEVASWMKAERIEKRNKSQKAASVRIDGA